jgi:hypothetical protein
MKDMIPPKVPPDSCSIRTMQEEMLLVLHLVTSRAERVINNITSVKKETGWKPLAI